MLLNHADRSKRDERYFFGHWYAANTSWWLGEFEKVLEHAQAIAMRYDPASHRALCEIGTLDPFSASLVWRGYAECALGYPDCALRSVEQGIAWAREIGYGLNTIFAVFQGSQIHGLRGEAARYAARLDEVVALARSQALPFYEHLLVPPNRARAALVSGDAALAESFFRSGIAAWAECGERISLPELWTLHAQALH